MNTQKHIDDLRKKDTIINDYFNGSTPLKISQFVSELPKRSRDFTKFLGNNGIDYIHLTALAKVLRWKREEDWAMLHHSKNAKNGYDGANELIQLLNDYSNGKIVISGIRFDFKNMQDKNGKKKTIDEIKTDSARSVRIAGNKMINGLINSMMDTKLKELTAVYASYINVPIFKPKEFPDRKADFVRKHNKIATHALNPFFASYKSIPLKERKILTMKVLVCMKFLEPYERYKKQTEEKGIKVLKETGYYLQRYNEFMR